MSFEELSKRLEEIVNKLEKENVTLEQSTELFDEGVKIAKQCYEIIEKNKGKINIIKKELDDILSDEED